MIDHEAHPSPDVLSAFSLGQLPREKADEVEGHVGDCETCCETLLGLADDDTFVGLLKDADQTAVESGDDVPGALVDHPRYDVVGLIGRGGMGDVYEARHRLMNRTVALKVINREFIARPEVVERFRREVETAAQLSHANVVAAYDAEQAGDLHFLVMEHVDGTDLSHVVKDRGPLPVEQACDYVRQAALGLDEAHRLGLTHRDIKPHNLMVTADGTVKVLDFGLASLVAGPDAAESGTVRSDLTSAGTVMGTPDFISPEQAADARNADARSDVYSLGATLYFLLTGRPLFTEGDVVQKLRSHAEEEPEPIDSVRDDLPAGLATVVSRMLAKDPDERFQTAAEVAVALEPFGRESKKANVPEISAQPPRRRGPFSRMTAFAAGFAALLVAAAVYFIVTNNGVVRVEVLDDSLNVQIDGRSVTLDEDGTKVLDFRAGDHEIVVRQGDTELVTDEFELRRNGKVQIRVTIEKGQVVVSRDREAPKRAELPGGPASVQWPELRITNDGVDSTGFDRFTRSWKLQGRNVGVVTARLVNITDGSLQVANERRIDLSDVSGDSVGHLNLNTKDLPEDRAALSIELNFDNVPESAASTKSEPLVVDKGLAASSLTKTAKWDGYGIDAKEAVLVHWYAWLPTTFESLRYGEDLDSLVEASKQGASFVVVTLEWSEAGDRDSFSPEVLTMLEKTGQSRAEFSKRLYAALSRAAGIPNDQWEAFAKDQAGTNPNEFVEGMPLSILLLSHAPLGGDGTDADDAFEAFRLLTDGLPKPREFDEAMAPSREQGYVSLLQPEYVKSTTLRLDAKSGLLRGTVSFEAPNLYASRVNFAVQIDRGRMKVVEFTLPNVMTIGPDKKGVWGKKASVVPTDETGGGEPKATSDSKAIQGVWKIVSSNGRAQPANVGDAYLVFTADTSTRIVGDDRSTRPYRIDPTTSPKRIDLLHEEGGPDEEGIYELDGDTLRLAFTRERPKSFEAGAGPKVVLVLERVEAEPSPKRDAVGDREAIRGTWNLVAVNGEEPPQKTSWFASGVVIGEKTMDQVGADDMPAGPYRIDPTKTPKQLDMLPVGRPAIPVIYELDGDTLRVGLSMKKGIRPESFATSALVLTYERKKSSAEDAVGDRAAIRGTWTLESTNGKPPRREDPGFEVGIVFGEKTLQGIEGADAPPAPYTIDPTKTPKQIDIRPADEPAMLGIYELEADTLRIGFSFEEGEYPKSFDKSFLVLTLKRKLVSEAGPARKANDIVERLEQSGRFKRLLEAVDAADLAEVLYLTEGLTLFAPTDEAFDTLAPEGTLDALLEHENKDRLADLLKYHIVSGALGRTDLASKRIEAVNGKSIDVVDGEGVLSLSGSKLVGKEIVCANGIVHVIDAVLLPPDVRAEVSPHWKNGKLSDPASVYAVAKKTIRTPVVELAPNIEFESDEFEFEIDEFPRKSLRANAESLEGWPTNIELGYRRRDGYRGPLPEANLKHAVRWVFVDTVGERYELAGGYGLTMTFGGAKSGGVTLFSKEELEKGHFEITFYETLLTKARWRDEWRKPLVDGDHTVIRGTGKRDSEGEGNAALVYWQAFALLPELNGKDAKLLADLEKSSELGVDAKSLLSRSETALSLVSHLQPDTPCRWAVIENGPSTLLPHLSKARMLARLLVLQARVDAASGKPEAAVDHLTQAFLVARNIDEGALVQMLVGDAIESLAADATLSLLPEFDASARGRFAEALSKLPTRTTFAHAVRYERDVFGRGAGRMIGDALDQLGKDADSPAVRAILAESKKQQETWLEEMLAEYDKAIEASKLPLPEATKELERLEAGVQDSPNPLIRLMMPSLVGTNQRHARVDARIADLESKLRDVEASKADPIDTARRHLRAVFERDTKSLKQTYADEVRLLPGHEFLKERYGLGVAGGRAKGGPVERETLVEVMRRKQDDPARKESVDEVFAALKFEKLDAAKGEFTYRRLQFAVAEGDELVKISQTRSDDFILLQLRQEKGTWQIVAEYLD